MRDVHKIIKYLRKRSVTIKPQAICNAFFATRFQSLPIADVIPYKAVNTNKNEIHVVPA